VSTGDRVRIDGVAIGDAYSDEAPGREPERHRFLFPAPKSQPELDGRYVLVFRRTQGVRSGLEPADAHFALSIGGP
jgi:hypothetical protein